MNSSNITIGKPGKGNYFRGVSYGIDNPEESYKRNSENISIQSNVFCYNDYGWTSIQDTIGNSSFVDALEYVIYCKNSKNINIWGDT